MDIVRLPGGRQASYEIVGMGRPALMFPGGPGFAASYMRGDAELFAGTLESYLVDPHGSGRSSPPSDPSEYSPEGHARFYEDVRKALGLDEVLLFGHSFGATTALTYAALFPQAVAACVAVAGFGIGPETATDEATAAEAEHEAALVRHAGARWYGEARAVMDAWTERVLATDDPHEVEQMMSTVLPLYTAHPDRPDVAKALDYMRGLLDADLAAFKAWEGGLYQTIDLRPILAGIRCRTLIVAGDLDFLCGPAQARPIAAAVPGSRLVVISDCGHVPSIEAPDTYKEAVLSFLAA